MKLLLVLLFACCAAALARDSFEEKDDSAEMLSEKIMKKIAVLEEMLESGADEDTLMGELKEAMQENVGDDLPEEYKYRVEILKELYGKLEEHVGEKGMPHRSKGYAQGRDSHPELWDRLDEKDAPFVR